MMRPGFTDSVCRAKGEMLVTMGTKSSDAKLSMLLWKEKIQFQGKIQFVQKS